MIRFEEITWDNADAVMKLEVFDHQKDFVAPNTYSLAQAFVGLSSGNKLKAFAIYHDKDLVGFILMFRDTGKSNEYGDDDAYDIMRFMIDKNHQNKGYGKMAMKHAIDYIKTQPMGSAEAIYLSFEPENLIAKGLYESLGFKETGQIMHGELVMRRSL